MGNPTLTPALITQLTQQGITIVGVPFGPDDQEMVVIEDANAFQSRVVTLASLTGCDNTHFNTPGVHRPLPAVAACSTEPVSTPEHDYELDACYMPTPENLDEILRQRASDDPVQNTEAALALKYAMDEAQKEGPDAVEALRNQINDATQRVYDEHPEDYQRVVLIAEQYKQELVTFSSQSIASGTPADRVVPSVSDPVVVASDIHFANDVGAPLGIASANDSGSPHGTGPHFEDDDFASPSPTVASAPVWVPVTVTPETIGLARTNDPALFPILFHSVIATQGTAAPAIVQILTSSDPEARRVKDSVCSGVSKAFGTLGISHSLGVGESPTPSQPMALGFRYVPERRGSEISLAPVGRDGRVISLPVEEDESTGFASLFPRFSNYSLALFPIGGGIRRPVDSTTGIVTVFVPFLPPSQYMFARHESRPVVGGMTRDGAATKQAVTGTAHRGDQGDEGHGGEGRGRDSRRERGDREGRHGSDREEYAQEEEAPSDSVAA